MLEVRAAICDDEPLALNMVASALKTCFEQQGVRLLLESYTDPQDFSRHIQRHGWQVVFLDIDMPKLDGITLGKQLKEANDQTDIIYISNCEDRVFDAFSAHPFGFVRKSSFLKDAESVARLYIASLQKNRVDKCLEVKSQGGVNRLKIQEISYIECDKDTQLIHLSGRNAADAVGVQLRMKILEEKLTPYGFLRIHTGYLVNYQAIRRFDTDTVQLQSGEVLPVSRRKRQEVFQAYMKLCRSDQPVHL